MKVFVIKNTVLFAMVLNSELVADRYRLGASRLQVLARENRKLSEFHNPGVAGWSRR
jgi:hypothetical protein